MTTGISIVTVSLVAVPMAGLAAAWYQYRVAQLTKDVEESRSSADFEKQDEVRKRLDLQVENERLSTALEDARRFIGECVFHDVEESDVVVLGPQYAGKTSLVRSLTKFWKAHQGTSPTTFFELHEFTYPAYRVNAEKREVVGTGVTVQTRAHVRIWDYGGEPHLVEEAIKKIESLESCVLLFVINVEPEFMQRNLEYYSSSFLARVDRVILSDRTGRLKKVFVLLNKIDTRPPAERSAEALQPEYSGLLHKMRTAFDNMAVRCVSSISGEGMFPFCQMLSEIFVNEDGTPRPR